MLTFVNACNGWASFKKDSVTLRVARSLAKRGLIEINEAVGQFRPIDLIKNQLTSGYKPVN